VPLEKGDRGIWSQSPSRLIADLSLRHLCSHALVLALYCSVFLI
jgi:hypothetical protein